MPWISHTVASNTDSFLDKQTYYESFCAAPVASGDGVATSQRHTRGPLRAGPSRARSLGVHQGHRPLMSMMPSSGPQPLISKQIGPDLPYTAGLLISKPEDFFQVGLPAAEHTVRCTCSVHLLLHIAWRCCEAQQATPWPLVA